MARSRLHLHIGGRGNGFGHVICAWILGPAGFRTGRDMRGLLSNSLGFRLILSTLRVRVCIHLWAILLRPSNTGQRKSQSSKFPCQRCLKPVATNTHTHTHTHTLKWWVYITWPLIWNCTPGSEPVCVRNTCPKLSSLSCASWATGTYDIHQIPGALLYRTRLPTPMIRILRRRSKCLSDACLAQTIFIIPFLSSV